MEQHLHCWSKESLYRSIARFLWRINNPTLNKEQTSSTSWNMGERSAASTIMSLSSLAKREHARKTLMSNFVRGKPIVPVEEPPAISAVKAESSKVVAAADVEAQAALDVTNSRPNSI